jgi:hypothetical protein
MLDALFRIFSHPLHERRVRNDVANVLVNERIPAPAAAPRIRVRTTAWVASRDCKRTLSCPRPPGARTPFSPS